MTTEAVVGLDAGTTSTKAVVMNSNGEVLAVGHSEPIRTVSPEPGTAEQEPRSLTTAMAEATRRALSALPSGVRITALAMAAQSGSVMPIGDDERPIGKLLTWMDARGTPIVEAWSLGNAALSKRNSARSRPGGAVWGPVCAQKRIQLRYETPSPYTYL